MNTRRDPSTLEECYKIDPDAYQAVLQDAREHELEVLTKPMQRAMENVEQPTYVYLVEAKNGALKIGKSKNPKDRIQQLKVGSPVDLKLKTCVAVPDANKAEKQLHDEFSNKRTRGEWFELGDGEKQSLVDRLNQLQNIWLSGMD